MKELVQGTEAGYFFLLMLFLLLLLAIGVNM